MTSRKRQSTRDLVALFQREKGICHLCNLAVLPGQRWDVSHDKPLAMGGPDDPSNWRVAHRRCHRAHTSAVDMPAIAKAKRSEAAHVGARRPKQPMKSGAKMRGPERTHEGRQSLSPRRLYEDLR